MSSSSACILIVFSNLALKDLGEEDFQKLVSSKLPNPTHTTQVNRSPSCSPSESAKFTGGTRCIINRLATASARYAVLGAPGILSYSKLIIEQEIPQRMKVPIIVMHYANQPLLIPYVFKQSAFL